MQFNDIKITGMKTARLNTSRRLFNESIGLLINIEKKNIYFTADTETTTIKLSPDLLLIPVGGTHTMNAKQAFQLAKQIRPKLIIPMHFGTREGTADDAMLFKELVENEQIAKVKILSQFEEIIL